ncbi:MAG: hypothetical protein OYI31_01130 [Chloroflexota bacterium]|nr:hypothetical protein [Chloroflexota bacterium]MDE2941170.1 hypothetical protein [Chloroflexota bacterium]MDE3267049.1 hypothetical protein [Chloroflexota bacterium]
MTWTRVLFWLLPRRLRSSWMLLAVSSFGILTAVTLMALGALYSQALAEGGLRHTLALTPRVALNAQVAVQNRPLGPADYDELRNTMEPALHEALGHLIHDVQRSGRAQANLPITLTEDANPPRVGGRAGQPFFLTGFREHTRLVEGRWPEAAPVVHESGIHLETVVGRQTAANMGFEIGQDVYLVPFLADPTERVRFTVVGIVEPVDPTEEYWMTWSTYYFTTQDRDPWTVAPIYMSEEHYFNALGARYSSLLGDYWWFLYLDTGALTADTAGPTRDAVLSLEKQLNILYPRSLVLSSLGETIDDYRQELTLARVPLFLFLSLVVAVVVYFLLLVLGLLARTQSDTANVLRSRGASMAQVSGLFALGEGIVVLASLAVGPLLALAIVKLLLVRTIDPAGAGGPVPVQLSANAFLMGAIGGLLSLVVLGTSGVGLARLGIVEFLRVRSRPATVPLLHRYYVDVLVIAVLALVWWQVEQRGGFVQRELAGGGLEQVDLSMLLGPVLALLAVAFLIPRLLPWLMRGLAWASGLAAPAWIALTLTRMARDPLPHSSLVIVVMMVTALGVFGASFQSTLVQSQEEQAGFRVGGDLVVRGASLDDRVLGEIAALPGVTAVTPVSREVGALVRVDPAALPHATWRRTGGDDGGLAAGTAQLLNTDEGSPGVALPEDADTLGVWVRVNEFDPSQVGRPQRLGARLVDRSGRHHEVSLGELPLGSPSDEWTFLEAALPLDRATPPFRLVSIYNTRSFSGSLGGVQPGSISLDDVTARGPSTPPEGVVVEGFEQPPGQELWVTLPNPDSISDSVHRSRSAAHTGGMGLTFAWRNSVGPSPRGILLPAGPFPLPAVGGPTFEVGQRPRVVADGLVIPVEVVDVIERFPTIEEPTTPFMLVNIADYGSHVARVPGSERPAPLREAWVALNDSVARSSAILAVRRVEGISSVEDREAAIDLARRNPLAGGGWNGLTILSMAALTVAAAMALGAHSVVSIQAGRIDLTLSEALGLTRLEVLLSLVFERVIVASIGAVIGSGVGLWLGRWVLGFLDVTSDGSPVVPPMIITTSGALAALVFVCLAAALSTAILATLVSLRRLRAPDVLRTGA